MKNVAYIGFIDAHTKGNGRDHNDAWVGHENILMGGAIIGIHARMIGKGANSIGI